ncbi:MAG: alpha/beta hydrolase [Actinomycetota bacterium]|nr:alpha/beta hydrolase [Actinomycetota bacterium]
MPTHALPDVPGVAHHFVEANGLRFHVAEAGTGDPLLMLHGWPQHWYMWRHVIPQLSRSYRVICPDLRGFGWSDAPATGYEKETLAADVLALMDEMDLDRVKLVGHDWGGYVGFLMTLFQPQRVERYLALSIVHPWIKIDLKRASAAWRSAYQWVLASPAGPWLLRTQPAVVERAILGGTYDKTVWRPQELQAFSHVLREPARAAASSSLYRTFLAKEMLPLVTGRYDSYRLEVPTRLLVGRHDPAIGTEMLEGYEPHATAMEHEIIEEASHFIVDEKPDLITAKAEAFFG